MPTLRNIFAFVLVAMMLSKSAIGDIDKPIKGKRYSLTEKHGPWMIMVAAIRDIEDETRRIDGGMSAWEAADEIVYQLREKGIPAYTYVQDKEVAEISNGAGQPGARRYVAQQGYISVMAGNFPDNSSSKAKETLEFVKKKFSPKFLSDEKNGGIYAKTRSTPFSRAFFTVNPLWKGEVRDAEEDKQILVMNSDQKYSLLQNKGKYSLIIATFHGSSLIQVGNKASDGAMGIFERKFGDNLVACAVDARDLTDKLRHARKYGYDEDYEAYVYHDKFKSYVTIGSFNSKNDPRMRTLATTFGGKVVRHPQTGEETIAGEAFTVPRYPKNGEMVSHSWLFDATPTPIAVPKIQ